MLNLIKIIFKQHLFLLIIATFLIGVTIIIVYGWAPKQPPPTIVKLIVQNTTQLSIVMLSVFFSYLFLDMLISSSKKTHLEEKEDNPTSDSAENQNRSSVNDSTPKETNFAGPLTRLLISSFSASTIPTGISLILCAFYGIELIEEMSGVEIYIAFAGFSLISIAYLSTQEAKTQMTKELGIGLDELSDKLLKKN